MEEKSQEYRGKESQVVMGNLRWERQECEHNGNKKKWMAEGNRPVMYLGDQRTDQARRSGRSENAMGIQILCV